jgi:succinylglutamic semialdehyde dehydrogenase
MDRTLFINGQWETGGGDPFESVNPATNAVLWNGSGATKENVDRAVSTAKTAQPDWAERDPVPFLEQFQVRIKEAQEELTLALSEEMGKPLWEAATEISAMAGKIRLSIAAHQERTGVSQRETPAGRAFTRHKPHGVVAVFGPFNFPGHLPNGHIVPALLAGNTVVFKPSELTPRFAQKMVELWDHLPPGVLNLVQGGPETGKSLSRHPDIDALFFTGSASVGMALSEQFGKTPDKLLALELGGNNPLIVDGVSDLQGAAYATIQSAYITAGQRCTCARRLIVPRGKDGDAFLQALIPFVRAVRAGPFTDDPEPFMGPLISTKSASCVMNAQKELIVQGAQSLVEATRPDPKGAFVTPGLLDVTKARGRKDEEVFGPLLQVIRVPDFESAIIEANNTRYGLSAGVFTDDEAKYREFFRRSRAGIVNWNSQTTGASGAAPFGGIGISGNHRPSAYYAADYCSYPVASVETERLVLPQKLSPGIDIEVEA